ncbi:hypothetical protein Aab01nite_51890 [Paractinoplanes abujensis]|uniref:Uncharacterized protein n=1 Tax=Paractinoplanes abujensis TaxID=882441 RepID=A0A7W7G2K0_9ACTN|nr:hypothetical protein [Actinoplanes abujensis]MBB4693744.1 hypothetical protein [Actinoplanes abujensis]GID21599.1 hypothetical protein Aab01nite_51890 [Actinoplanes abujensis]
MRPVTRTALAVAAVAGGAAAVTLARRARTSTGEPRWHTLTVYRPLTEVDANLPEELRTLEVRLVAAPGDRGTEVHARAFDGGPSDGEVQRILRESRSLLEVGDVLRPGGPTTTPTLFNLPLRSVTSRTRTGGLL